LIQHCFLKKNGEQNNLMYLYLVFARGAVLVVIVWWLDLQLTMQSVPITTNVVDSNPDQARCTRYNIMR